MLRKKILLANDAELLKILEDSFFRRAGFTLLVAENGEQAFEMIEEQDPSLAILTLDMQGREGDSICRRVKEDPVLRSTPVILLVSGARKDEVDRCHVASCDDILFRPIDSQQLMAAASRLLHLVDRRVPRVETSFPAMCGSDPQKLRRGTALNINAGGLFVQTDRLHPVDTLLTVEFTLPGESLLLRCKGRVAWVNHPEWIKTTSLPSGLGIQFLDLTEDAEAALRRFIEKTSAGM